MDPITLAFLAALCAGAAEGIAGSTVGEAYKALRARLSSKAGADSTALERVEQLEHESTDIERARELSAELGRAGVCEDADLLGLAEQVMNALGPSSQSAVGSYIAQADHRSTASVTMLPPRDDRG